MGCERALGDAAGAREWPTDSCTGAVRRVAGDRAGTTARRVAQPRELGTGPDTGPRERNFTARPDLAAPGAGMVAQPERASQGANAGGLQRAACRSRACDLARERRRLRAHAGR